ncbi:hypothetical protein GCM10022280_03520 [Sphingomonas swuensis]|uniref:Uncharacterized protein n=1 Tax=Sphingomonas swuensis TaxID=977800 RepID=A0ABP7SCE8_9SPHN
MTMSNRSLAELQADFRASSTNAMPIAGMITWAALGIAATALPERTVANASLYIMAVILPLAFVIDRARGRNLFGGGDNPLVMLFLRGIIMVALTVPLAVIGAKGGQPLLVLLGMAILAGVVWIPFGWAADDQTGTVHAVARGIGCYLAYGLVPAPWTGTAICAVVVLAYLYSLAFMRPLGPQAEVRPAAA